jgi:hypothetical protein
MAGWQKGVSGNPHGRPPTARSLTKRLADELSHQLALPDGRKATGKAILAQMRVAAALTGKLTLLDGTEHKLGPDQILALQAWIFAQVDGPPKAELDLTSGGGPLRIVVEYADIDPDGAPAAPGAGADQAGGPAL